MPNDYVNKVQKGQTEYDIHDARMPIPASGDAGKVIKVSEALGFELGDSGSGNEAIKEMTDFSFGSTTFQDVIDFLGLPGTSGTNGQGVFTAKGFIFLFQYSWYGPFNGTLTQISASSITDYKTNDKTVGITHSTTGDHKFLPADNELSAEKTYVLKFTNGSLQWVEENA